MIINGNDKHIDKPEIPPQTPYDPNDPKPQPVPLPPDSNPQPPAPVKEPGQPQPITDPTPPEPTRLSIM
jgi:hypothetical protein